MDKPNTIILIIVISVILTLLIFYIITKVKLKGTKWYSQLTDGTWQCYYGKAR